MRCPDCGAVNADSAPWCTLCHVPFGSGSSGTDGDQQPGTPGGPDTPDEEVEGLEPSPPVSVGATTEGDPTRSSPTRAPTGDDTSSSSPRRSIREVDGEVEWRCGQCATWVLLEVAQCPTCGAGRVGFGESAVPSPGQVRTPTRTLLLSSAALPGLGHVLAGHVGSGVTRGALWLLWAVGGLWWVLATPSGRAPGLVLLTGAVVLWVVALLDVRAVAAAKVEPFGVRGLLWTVVAVTGLLMVMVAFTVAGSVG